MISASDLKKDTAFILNGKPHKVVKYDHLKVGRGGATVRVSLRDLETGGLVEKTMNSTAKLEEISTSKRKLQYLYHDAVVASFMDPTTFEQVEISLKVIENELPFVKEGEDVEVLFWENKALSVEISPKVTLEVKETAPGVKGNSATNVYKPATLENGLEVKVPLFIKAGDKVRVDTRTGGYIERAN